MRKLAICLILALIPAQAASAHGTTGGCHDAVNFLWPKNARSFAHRVVRRESRGNPHAQNRRSSAAGCFQLLRLHAWRFEKYGYTWADRYNPMVNTLVAYDLFKQAGTRPWR